MASKKRKPERFNVPPRKSPYVQPLPPATLPMVAPPSWRQKEPAISRWDQTKTAMANGKAWMGSWRGRGYG